jgi:DNA-binding NtrC family response regulator
MPPLRDRLDDLPVLAKSLLDAIGRERQVDVSEVELDSELWQHAWPGNVRELRNFIERSVSLGLGSEAEPSRRLPLPSSPDLDGIVPTHLPLKDARAAWTEQFEFLYVKALLAKTQGNVTRAAELAGVNRRSLQRLIASVGIRDQPEAKE